MEPYADHVKAPSPLGKEPGPILPSSAPEDRPRQVIGPCVHRAPVQLKESTLCDRHDIVMDLGLFKSRSFRVGWGPAWGLTAKSHGKVPIPGMYVDILNSWYSFVYVEFMLTCYI